MASSDSNIVISAFTEDQVERLTGITPHQLRYWDRTGFFRPSFASDDRRIAYSRIYSFRDVVSLQVLNSLRNDIGVSLPHLREVKEKLQTLGEDAWARVTLYVVKKKVVFDDPETGDRVEVVDGQGIVNIPLEPVRAKMLDRLATLRARDERTIGDVSRSRRVAHNASVVAGTRIPTRAIKDFAAEGYDVPAILREYPTLTEKDVLAALKSEKAA
jgi:DNA-binding transcriptional MerR regulator